MAEKRYRIIAVTRKPDSASFQQRVAAYVGPLAERGITVDCDVLPRSLCRQRQLLGRLGTFDGAWWQRHLLMPWLLPALRRRARRLVFDFDDPLVFSATGGGRRSFSRSWRFAALVRRCDAVLAASETLAELARPFCGDVAVLPMAVDLPQDAPPVDARPPPVRLLWIGSAATQPYLELVRPPLERFGRQRPDLSLRLVAHEPMSFGALRVDYQPWSAAAEEASLRDCHIGLCPLPDTVWTRGKCSYKVLQYMANGLPWVGSRVGENLRTAGEASRYGPRGFCAAGQEQWLEQLGRLVDDAALRRSMGERGRRFIEQRHDRRVLVGQLAATWRRWLGG